jgi:enoyl-CoA hydratase/carnithine racemase
VDYTSIRYELRGEVALITLNRPDRLNAWTPRMALEQVDALERANDDPAVGAIVMTGAGRGFCAGADMQDTFQTRLDGTDPGEDTAHGQGGMPARVDWVSLLRQSKPLVAAVNGAAVGVGMTMILPCDVIVASQQARFGMFFIRMGIVPELASTHFLVQRMGFGRASEMCLSGRLLDAQEAFDAGLADRLVAPEALLDTSLELARGMGANPGPQLRMIKELLTRNACETDLLEAQRRETRYLLECYETPEHKEAVRAFIEKRKPNFR